MKIAFTRLLRPAVLLAGPLIIAVAVAGQGSTAKAERIKRGEYLTKIMGCGDCHTPMGRDHRPIPGMEFAGHPAGAPLPQWDPEMLKRNILATFAPTATAMAGPWGVSVAGNLTPDMETGIGGKTAADLIKSWRTGIHWKVNRPVLPPMPIEAYKHATDEDITAIFEYLMSLKPIKNKCPDSVLAPGMGGGS